MLASLGSAPALAEAVALLLLAGTLAFAVVRPRGLPEAVAAVPAAALAVALGILPAGRALRELRDLGPTIGFLAAVLVLAELCEREGLFEAAGHWMAGASMGRPVRLLSLVFAVGAAVVAAVSAAGLGNAVERLVPAGASLPALLAVAATAALLANLVNNLPAILLLLPAVSAAGPGPVLAALVGVNVGPNLTYVGSLATLLWRRALRARDAEPPVGEFLRLGALTVPAALLCATLALWVALRWLGP